VRPALPLLLTLLLAPLAALQASGAPADRPDVLFILADDMNVWIQTLDRSSPIVTPNLDRLARRGVTFTLACAASPACNPSRTALLTGRAPSSTGVYGNSADWRGAMPDVVTLPQAFMRSGYRVEGAGKVFHHHMSGTFHDRASFHEFLDMPWPPDAPMPASKLNRLPGFGSANTDWGPWPAVEADHLDVRSTDWCIERLRRPRSGPLFLACGLFRPHMPFYVPERWLDRYPADKTVLPTLRPDDVDDIPPAGRALRDAEAGRFWQGMMQAEKTRPGSWREAVRCYQAAATFADGQIGRLLDALDASPRGKSTIIVFCSDNGYQLGEKGCWEKFTLWERASRIPLIIAAPGVTPAGASCGRPVSLLDVYPTLVELCGLEPAPALDGRSVKPLLLDPTASWEHPAVMTYLRGNHAVRSQRHRYIRYANGDEELYDHFADPHEWTNLASRPDSKGVIAELARHLPRTDAPPAKDMLTPKGKAEKK
jgi:arylsulfatase A-like enzyme